MRKTWRLLPNEAPGEVLADLSLRLGISQLISGLLWQRGFRDQPAMDVFLAPTLRHLRRPEDFPGMAQAAQALTHGLANGRRLAVWGDYDVDGVTATALICDFFTRRGHPVIPYIPSRLQEGYGLNPMGLRELADQGVNLLLTVDCGIAALEEIEVARSMGMEVVVTDHHLPGDRLPDCLAVCNPRLPGSPFPHLAGVGVAFYLACAVNRLLPGDPLDMRQFLDLVAMGTLADVVELSGENRILVKNGLLVLKEAARPGVFALKEASGYPANAELGAGQVVFGLAPRINAAGRLGRAQEALALLLAPSREKARPLAAALDRYNQDRRREEEKITAEAISQAEEQVHRQGIVLYGAHWHPGVVGIVASRIVERFYRPTLVLSLENALLKGSGRSIREFDLYQALSDCAEVLAGFGGHRQAAGLRLPPDNLDRLRELFHDAVVSQLGQEPPIPSLKLDAEVPLERLDFTLLKELELLQPYGMGNPEPVFLSPSLLVVGYRIFGANHLLLHVRDETSGITLGAKAWRMAEAMPRSLMGQRLRLAYTPRIDTFGGVAAIELTIKDWRLDADAQAKFLSS